MEPIIKSYRKKPVVIEAVHFETPDMAQQIANWCGGNAYYKHEPHQMRISINTLEGNMDAVVGDYVIKGIQGEFYPCKSDIFLASYEDAGAVLAHGNLAYDHGKECGYLSAIYAMCEHCEANIEITGTSLSYLKMVHKNNAICYATALHLHYWETNHGQTKPVPFFPADTLRRRRPSLRQEFE